MRPILAVVLSAMLAGCVEDESSSESDFRSRPALGPEPEGTAARYPIVLAHGFNAAPGAPGGFERVADALRADGHTVIEAKVPPFNSVEVRANALAREVDAILAGGAEKVNIVAHSMGGLDTRYLVSELGYGDVVVSVTTISTPHRGSPVADQTLAVLDGLKVDDKLVDDVARYLGLRINDLAADTDVRATMTDLSEEQAIVFNATMPDDPRVFYQSWAGVSSVGGIKNWRDAVACEDVVLGQGVRPDVMSPLLVPLAATVAAGELRPNDGLVAVESAQWGDFRGCVPADHLDEVGVRSRKGRDPNTGFDHVRFYRNVAFELSELGF